MKLWPIEELPKLPKLNLAVVGHVEWMTFLSVEKFPKAGEISHGDIYLEQPAGGGAVTAANIASVTGSNVHFFTALGRDSTGKKSFDHLQRLNLNPFVAWHENPTRRGISMVDSKGERAITVIGDRLQPSGKDRLPWKELSGFDGVFITATDIVGLKHCRKASLIVASPRLGIKTIQESKIQLDALIGSALDPDENVNSSDIKPIPKLRVATEGALGGQAWPGGRFSSVKLPRNVIDTYGCGDSFAAGVTIGLAAGWSNEQAISLGAHCGADCALHLGPFKSLN